MSSQILSHPTTVVGPRHPMVGRRACTACLSNRDLYRGAYGESASLSHCHPVARTRTKSPRASIEQGSQTSLLKLMNKTFFARDTRRVAKDLLGMEIIRKVGSRMIRAVIIETEAYKGFSDKASHASRGKTQRNAPMFDEPGTLYVYLIYGMYWCLNIVTERKDYPAAVLIRGIKLLPSGELISGPGRVCRALKITGALSGKSIFDKHSCLALGCRTAKSVRFVRAPRIGVDYAGVWARKPWRYLIE